MLGYESECKESNTLSLDTSHSIVPLGEGNGIAMSLSEDVASSLQFDKIWIAIC